MGKDESGVEVNCFVYIYSREHGAFWREGGHGYTMNKSEAGVFPYSYAVRFTGRSYSDKMIELIPAEPDYEI